MVSNYTLLLLIAAVITLTLAYLSYRRRSIAGARPFALLMLAVTVWSAAYGFEINSTNLTAITFWVRIEYIGIVFIPPFWLAFALHYTGRKHWLSRGNLLLLAIEPILALALFWTNSIHGLFWKDIGLVEMGNLTLATFTHGAGFWVNAVYSYLLLMTGSFFIVSSLIRSRKLFRSQLISIMIGVAAPWVGNGFYLSGLTPFPYLDPTPFAFTASGIAVTWALFHYRFLEIVPIAQATLIANLPDGVIVLDPRDRIVDINPTAEKILKLSNETVIGSDAGTVFHNYQDLVAALENQGTKPLTITQAEAQEIHFYDVRVSPIIGDAHSLAGRIIVFRDITEQEKNAVTLKNREAILEAVRFAATNFLMANTWEESIQTVLERLGEAAKVSRVYIFENQVLSDGVLVASQRYEWAAPGITKQINNPELKALRYREDGFERWVQILSQQQPLHGLIEEFPPSERELLKSQQIESIIVAPIFVRQLWWGFIGFDECTYKRRWSRAEIDALEAAATTLGSSILRMQTDHYQHQKAAELATLLEISLEITSSHEIPKLLHVIVEKAVELLGGTGGGLYLCDHKKREVRCVTSINTSNDYTGTVLKFGEGASGMVAQTGQSLIIDDYRTWEGRAMVYEEDQPFRSVISAPLNWLGETIGVINIIHNRETTIFDKDDLELLNSFANQAAIALHNAQMYELVQQRARRMDLLNEITHAALKQPDLHEMLQTLVDRLGDLMEADNTYITLWDEAQQRTIPIVGFSEQGAGFPAFLQRFGETGMTESVLRAGHPLAVENVHNTPYVRPHTAGLLPMRSMLALPLIIDRQKLGAAFIGFNQQHIFTPEEITLGEQAASQISLAVAKTRMLESERHRVNELNTLRSVMTDISAELELAVLLRTILERATTLLNATGGDLGLYEKDQGEILIVVSHNMGKDYRGTRMALGEGAMGRAVKHNETVVVTNYHLWAGRSPQYEEGPWNSALAVPLHFRGKIVGALGIVDVNPERNFSQEDQRLLHLFAQQAATAIENARLYASEKKRVAELEILYESSASMAKTLDLDLVYNIAAKQLTLAVNATSAYILSCDLKSGKATVLADYVTPSANVHERKSDIGISYELTQHPKTLAALRDGRPLTIKISDPNIDPSDFMELTQYKIKSSICVPMIISENLIGYAEVWDSLEERNWSDDEILLCQTLANQAAVAIENSRLYNEIQHQAVTDVLTGIYNRRGLFEIGQREINRIRRFSAPLAAIMLDLDHFKQINDRYSHAIGDQVLQFLIRICSLELRQTDVFGRYGGEEFAILLPETDQLGAYRLAERLRNKVSSTPMITDAGTIHVTISMGIATAKDEIEDLAVLLDKADTAMYAAKQAGRDRVCVDGVAVEELKSENDIRSNKH